MSFTIKSRPSVTTLSLPLLEKAQVTAAVLRLDEVHPIVSGNKWYKLKVYLAQAKAMDKTAIVTFGGAYSNHIVATAAICAAEGLASFGIIRGEAPAALSPALEDAHSFGMQLFFVNREAYRSKAIPPALETILSGQKHLIIEEGGYGHQGMQGASAILQEIDPHSYSHILCAVGTGTMLAGLTLAAMPHQQVTGISVLKNNLALEEAVRHLLPKVKHDHFRILHGFHVGGYAKKNTCFVAINE